MSSSSGPNSDAPAASRGCRTQCRYCKGPLEPNGKPDCKQCHNIWRRILRTAKKQEVEEFVKKYRTEEAYHGSLLFKDFRCFCDDDDLPRTRDARRFDFRQWAKHRLKMTDQEVKAIMPPQEPDPEHLGTADPDPWVFAAEATEEDRIALADAADDDDDVADDVPDMKGRPGTGDRAPDSPCDPARRRANIHVIVECECDAQVRLTIRNVRPRAA
jgi:hypothetical protein